MLPLQMLPHDLKISFGLGLQPNFFVLIITAIQETVILVMAKIFRKQKKQIKV